MRSLPLPLAHPCASDGFRLQGALPTILQAALVSSGLTRFLAEPLPQDLGLVQLRLIGDHTNDELYVAFDYAEGHPHRAHALVSCTRVRRRRSLPERRRKYRLNSEVDGTALGEVECMAKSVKAPWQAAGLPQAQFRVSTCGGGGEVHLNNAKAEGTRRKLRTVHANMANGEDDAAELHYVNHTARFNTRTKSFTLDFGGRVTLASTKNFMLCAPTGNLVQPFERHSESSTVLERSALRFGRMAQKLAHNSEAQFALDVRHPLSPLQAIGIAMASLLTR